MKKRWLNVIIFFTILVNVGLTVPATRYPATFILLWLLPGLAWVGLLTDWHSQPTAEDVAVGLGLGIGTVVILTLLFHYIPGPLTVPMLLVAVNLLIFALVLFTSHLSLSNFRSDVYHLPLLIVNCSLVILVAAFFRLTDLSYSEFQGDEGIVMTRAARAILGDDEQLFYHQKGPAEVLLPTATWALAGTINEWQARLPFVFVGLLGVVALYLLGRRWFGEQSGLIASLLLAINGYFVGFGRIVQYQSLVLAATALALLAIWRWSEGEGRRWLVVGAGLLAFGLLAHYDAGLALPAAVYVVGRRLWVARSRWRVLLVDVLSAGLLAFGILALFYVPFARHPNFARTMEYLSGARLGAGQLLYNNLLSLLPLAAFYNSTYYLVGLACLAILASFLSFRRLGLLIPAICFLILQFAICNQQFTTWAGPVLACLLVAIILSRHSSVTSRVVWLWFSVPFLFYYFLVWDPRTHVMNIFPGAVLLAAWALNRFLTFVLNLVTLSSRRWLSIVANCSLLAAFLFLAYYPYLMFVQHDPEIKRTWPAHQPSLYWMPHDETPLFGYFGFPYQAGWKVVGALFEEGVLSGVYASNEEQQITDWYTRGAERTYCPHPTWYLIAQNVQDEVKIHWSEIETEYYLWGEIQVAGETKLRIYYHQGHPVASPAIYHVEDYTSRFDAGTTPANVMPSPPADYIPAGYTLGGTVQLMGYRLNTVDAHPGGTLHLVLYWEALGPIETNYQVFNHLYDGTMWGQQDGTPGCALQPTVFWEPGHIIHDEYDIQIDPLTPAGGIPLLVGMYSLSTGARLPVCDSDNSLVGDAIPLTVVTVQ